MRPLRHRLLWGTATAVFLLVVLLVAAEVGGA